MHCGLSQQVSATQHCSDNLYDNIMPEMQHLMCLTERHALGEHFALNRQATATALPASHGDDTAVVPHDHYLSR